MDANAFSKPCKEKASTNVKFYQDALSYWSSIPPTVDGMLGGFAQISRTDTKGSTAFLKQLRENSDMGRTRALDCGAGIGRVTRHLLLPLFDTVDLLEVNKNFLDEAPNYIGKDSCRVGEYYCIGMQEFTPTHKYDLIWCQWVIGHLTDEHLTEFFKRCATSLKPNGVIVVKDNVSGSRREFDKTDSSFTRTLSELLKVIKSADLQIIKQELQEGFPVGIYDVPMIACRSLSSLQTHPTNSKQSAQQIDT